MAFLGSLPGLTGVVLCLIAVCSDLLVSGSSGWTVRMWYNVMANVRSIVACMGVIEGYELGTRQVIGECSGRCI
ncbi:hypothetical protein CDL15_Pgr014862 [Punica granatum]|uniref:Uncharacterized protein n=1 Tax=Punica granatum TaxID=22663 RepID=A0A218Y171_PUNGR|nr:hypothetical protein CDL15_Pgr014862 [Punica granatum]